MVQVQHDPTPTTTKKRTLREVWNEDPMEILLGTIVVGIIIALLAFVIAIAAHVTDDSGISKADVKVIMANDLGLQYESFDKVSGVNPDSVIHITSKRTACELTANQAVNFNLTELPLDQLLAVCRSIK